MSKEGQSLQYDMFSGELVDARSDHQKKKDRERNVPQQTMMFKTPEIVQFGARTHSAYRDWLDQATAPALVLEIEDTRTQEEIELDLLRASQKLTKPMFELDNPADHSETIKPSNSEPAQLPQSGIIFDARIHCKPIGLRARLRAQSAQVRSRFPRH